MQNIHFPHIFLKVMKEKLPQSFSGGIFCALLNKSSSSFSKSVSVSNSFDTTDEFSSKLLKI